MEKINFLIDIDGTITKEDILNEMPELMPNATALLESIIAINKWYDEGHNITFFTSRTEYHKEITEDWLKKHKFKYHSVIYNKSRGGNYVWIDNHKITAHQFKNNWKDIETKINELCQG